MKKLLNNFIIFISLYLFSCENEFLNYEINLSESNSENTPLIILMHGYGESASSYMGKGHFSVDFSVIYLDAPFPIHPLSIRKKWYDFRISNGDTSSNQDQIETSSELIIKTIKYIIKDQNIKSKKIYLGGHSQGGIMTYALAFKYPELFHGFIISSGRLPVDYLIKDELQSYKNKKALIIHGKKDDVLDIKFSSAGKRLLNKLGMQIQYLVRETGHGQVPDFIQVVEKWINM